MIKIICLAALIAVVAAMPNGPSPMGSSAEHVPEPSHAKREASAPETVQGVDQQGSADEATVEAKDDLDNAETFGFGYHKVVHVHVPAYPVYRHYHPGLYYPSHYYGHYW